MVEWSWNPPTTFSNPPPTFRCTHAIDQRHTKTKTMKFTTCVANQRKKYQIAHVHMKKTHVNLQVHYIHHKISNGLEAEQTNT